MSLENAKRFLEAAAKDQTLQQKLTAANPRISLASPSRRAPSVDLPSQPRSSRRVSGGAAKATAPASSATISSNLSPVAPQLASLPVSSCGI